MSEAVIVALIVAIAPTLASIAAVLVALAGFRRTGAVVTSINGRMDQLLKTVRLLALREGAAQERAHPTSPPPPPTTPPQSPQG